MHIEKITVTDGSTRQEFYKLSAEVQEMRTLLAVARYGADVGLDAPTREPLVEALKTLAAEFIRLDNDD